MDVLVASASKHGSTHEIRDRIAVTLRKNFRRVTVTTLDLDELIDGGPHIDVNRFDGVVLGSGVYYGHWLDSAHRFIDEHAEDLRNNDVWLFSSGPLVPGPLEWAPEDVVQSQELVAQVGALESVLFAGALDRQHLHFAERAITFALQAPDGDYRDWACIEAWAKRIGEYVVTRSRTASVERVLEKVPVVDGQPSKA